MRVYVVEFLKGIAWGLGLMVASFPMGVAWSAGQILAQRMLNR